MPRGLCALRTLTVCVPPTTSYFCALSAFGARIVPGTNLYRTERRSRSLIPNASKRQFGSVNLGSPGPLFARHLKTLNVNHVWVAACVRAQARRPTGDFLRDYLKKVLEAFKAFPCKGKGWKWVAFKVVLKDRRDWMIAAKNVDMWHRGVERGAEAFDNAWRRADLRQLNVRRQHEAIGFV